MPDQTYRIGAHWLAQRPGSRQWYRMWFDAETRQTRRASLGTSDFEAAKVMLAAYVTLNVPGRDQHPRHVVLATVFARYWENHGRTVRSGPENRHNLAQMVEVLPEGITVDELTPDAQKRAAAQLRKTLAAGTVQRIFTIARAAVNWAWENRELDRPISFITIPGGAGHSRERVLSIPELTRLWQTEMPDHVRVFIALAIGTGGRPGAILDLTRDQCDLDAGIINLNPPGRAQTKKRRPRVPMVDWLRPFIERADGPIVGWQGKSVTKIAGAVQTVRNTAGFRGDVTSTTIRHSIATHLRARGVPQSQISELLGHEMPGSRTTVRYQHMDPSWMQELKAALEAIGTEIGISIGDLRASCVPVDRQAVAKSLIYGAGEGIRTLDPNLGKVGRVKINQRLRSSKPVK